MFMFICVLILGLILVLAPCSFSPLAISSPSRSCCTLFAFYSGLRDFIDYGMNSLRGDFRKSTSRPPPPLTPHTSSHLISTHSFYAHVGCAGVRDAVASKCNVSDIAPRGYPRRTLSAPNMFTQWVSLRVVVCGEDERGEKMEIRKLLSDPEWLTSCDGGL
jgi:hypothetical protein